MIDALNEIGMSNLSYLHDIVRDCRFLASRVDEISYSYVARNSKKVVLVYQVWRGILIYV